MTIENAGWLLLPSLHSIQLSKCVGVYIERTGLTRKCWWVWLWISSGRRALGTDTWNCSCGGREDARVNQTLQHLAHSFLELYKPNKHIYTSLCTCMDKFTHCEYCKRSTREWCLVLHPQIYATFSNISTHNQHPQWRDGVWQGGRGIQ